jgi:hypothetical protein
MAIVVRRFSVVATDDVVKVKNAGAQISCTILAISTRFLSVFLLAISFNSLTPTEEQTAHGVY